MKIYCNNNKNKLMKKFDNLICKMKTKKIKIIIKKNNNKIEKIKI